MDYELHNANQLSDANNSVYWWQKPRNKTRQKTDAFVQEELKTMAIFRELATQTARMNLGEFNDLFMDHMLHLTKYGKDGLRPTRVPVRLRTWGV